MFGTKALTQEMFGGSNVKHKLFWVERIRYLEYLDSKWLEITPIYKPFILAMHGDGGPKQPDP